MARVLMPTRPASSPIRMPLGDTLTLRQGQTALGRPVRGGHGTGRSQPAWTKWPTMMLSREAMPQATASPQNMIFLGHALAVANRVAPYWPDTLLRHNRICARYVITGKAHSRGWRQAQWQDMAASQPSRGLPGDEERPGREAVTAYARAAAWPQLLDHLDLVRRQWDLAIIANLRPALWAGKGSVRADRGKKVLGYGPGPPARRILFSPARATSARRPRPTRASPGEKIPPPGLCERSPGCGQCVSRCTTRARTPRPTVSLSARIAPLAAMVISQPRRVLGRRMCLRTGQRLVVRSVTTCLHVRCGMGAARSWRTPVSWLAAGTAGGRPPRPLGHWLAGAFQSRSWTMTPLGSVTWNARSPQGSSRSGMVISTPSPRRRASSPSRSSTTNARIRPAAWVSRWSSGSKARPRRRKTTFIPASSRAREAKPSAAISCRKPKWLVRNEAEAGTSATLRDTAEAVICTGGLLGLGDRDGNQHCI